MHIDNEELDKRITKELNEAAMVIRERVSKFILEMRQDYHTPAELVAFLTILIDSALDIFASIHLACRVRIDENIIKANVEQFEDSLRERAYSITALLNDFEDHMKSKYNFKE